MKLRSKQTNVEHRFKTNERRRQKKRCQTEETKQQQKQILFSTALCTYTPVLIQCLKETTLDRSNAR